MSKRQLLLKLLKFQLTNISAYSLLLLAFKRTQQRAKKRQMKLCELAALPLRLPPPSPGPPWVQPDACSHFAAICRPPAQGSSAGDSAGVLGDTGLRPRTTRTHVTFSRLDCFLASVPVYFGFGSLCLQIWVEEGQEFQQHAIHRSQPMPPVPEFPCKKALQRKCKSSLGL